MAKHDFTRTIVTSTIKVFEVKFEKGVPVNTGLKDVVLIDKAAIKPDKIEKMAKAAYPGKNILIGEVVFSEETRGMDFDTFLKYSEVVVRPASQAKKEN